MEGVGTSRETRSRLVLALRRELLGPTKPDEVITEFPTSRYVVGRLAPALTDATDTGSRVEDSENDTLALDVADGEEGAEEQSPPLIIGFNPSSFGLSFMIDPAVVSLRAIVSWGDYRREVVEVEETSSQVWRRYQRDVTIEGISVSRSGPIRRIVLSQTGSNLPGVRIVGCDDPEIVLEGVVRQLHGYKAVSLFLVNRRTKGEVGDRAKDERWIFQPQLKIYANDNSAIFVAKDVVSSKESSDDAEEGINKLLYREAREFATGHGVSAEWAAPKVGDTRTSEISTEYLPQHEVPLLIAPSEQTGGAMLDMKELAEVGSADKLAHYVEPMIAAYERWIDSARDAATVPEIAEVQQLAEAANTNLSQCAEAARRMRSSVELLMTDRLVFEAFAFANRAMWDQRIHSLWAANNRGSQSSTKSRSEFDIAPNRTWRPFQMGFILLNLRGIADPSSDERRVVDLLWFPTGGGKTEAYLGLSAFAIALRRLRGNRWGMVGGAGVSILMRYTLRLLTVQQFQRAAALICACEVYRRTDTKKWGEERFQIGIWVGGGTTPNKFVDSARVLEDARAGKKSRGGTPVQLVSCPRCGTRLVDDLGFPVRNSYQVDKTSQRTIVWCCRQNCEFSAENSNQQGLPVVLVDDEIYRTCPSLLLATVDKFARLPFKGQARTLFGLRDQYSPTYGHLSEADEGKVGSKVVRDAIPAKPLLPPDLIIQDELHLISGPLGTMVGLYESAVDFASSLRLAGAPRIPAKVIASTATIRRAAQQAQQLYGGRALKVFPPPATASQDSFFARELPIDPEKDSTAGRLFVGINAPGSSSKTLLVRVYSALLAAGQEELARDAPSADPYGTLVGYFNSLRALGGAKRLVEDDVQLVRLKYLAKQRGYPRRNIGEPRELTSRIDSSEIPKLLKVLDAKFPRGANDWPVDVLLATNMISVGVDIDRLGLMVVTGQPKTTAEYIQATSRVGRKHPGLVVTTYNWLGARDISHYERFRSYHSALYRYVEAISVTPFSSRALDRGLRAVFTAMNRLIGKRMGNEEGAMNFSADRDETKKIVEELYTRAALLVGKRNGDLVRERLLSYCDDWTRLAEEPLRYSWLSDNTAPPRNSKVLLRTSGTENQGIWAAPGSLREVEPTAAFFLDDSEE